MPLIINLVPTTELEAVNAMLSAIGEAPLADLSSPTTEVSMALNILRMTTREVQSRGWRFNREYNYPLAQSGTYGAPAKYTFQAPSGLISYTLSRTDTQRGLDIITRKNRVAIGANAIGSLSIIADRLGGNDGWSFTTMYLDVIWFVDFESMPDSARRAVTAIATQQYALNTTGTPELATALAQSVTESTQGLVNDQSEESRAIAPTQDPSTELGAVNAILVSNGQKPTPSLTQLSTGESATALDLLRSTLRAVLLEGWTFNTDKGYKLTPSAGPVSGLYSFSVPALALKWDTTKTIDQLDLDLSERVVDDVRSIYDRTNNVFGIQADELFLDVTWKVDYADLPESAKNYVTIRAARIWSKNNALQNVKWTDVDELSAFRSLKRDQGNDDVPNLLDNADTMRFMGGRARTYGRTAWNPVGRRPQ